MNTLSPAVVKMLARVVRKERKEFRNPAGVHGRIGEHAGRVAWSWLQSGEPNGVDEEGVAWETKRVIAALKEVR
jgi:hypothetical protein